eukprot:gnl/MRDRNA2_/MRDRNA2_110322_c0_seq1.p1 gnl/MRDRNA2_/MRDRNA2_110322_c0~~gnl/MRDRNA2_/MRDRNA2_110322_c0_seq1.p1  ORF type:complete len:267 (+),score=24.79 gnl/MRDRNA2_/MRDRNA2_110322_c0_seq1:48-848(+)
MPTQGWGRATFGATQGAAALGAVGTGAMLPTDPTSGTALGPFPSRPWHLASQLNSGVCRVGDGHHTFHGPVLTLPSISSGIKANAHGRHGAFNWESHFRKTVSRDLPSNAEQLAAFHSSFREGSSMGTQIIEPSLTWSKSASSRRGRGSGLGRLPIGSQDLHDAFGCSLFEGKLTKKPSWNAKAPVRKSGLSIRSRVARSHSAPSVGVLSAETEDGSMWDAASAQTEVSLPTTPEPKTQDESLNRVYYPEQNRDGWYDWRGGRMLG